jgi:hypothetical protein
MRYSPTVARRHGSEWLLSSLLSDGIRIAAQLKDFGRELTSVLGCQLLEKFLDPPGDVNL